jgi:hypothetical protein
MMRKMIALRIDHLHFVDAPGKIAFFVGGALTKDRLYDFDKDCVT